MFLRPLKYYTVNLFAENAAYTDFLNKSMKLLQAWRLELRIIRKNGLIQKLLSWSMLAENCFWSLESQSFTLMKKITKKLSVKFKKILKSMGLPSKAVTALNICLNDKNEIVFNATKNCSIFKNYFSSLARNLVSKLLL